MNYIREFLYRPKRSDKSNMARFFYADENLTAVAAELDSFDGRKDPERCACLVNRLRSCQDKLLNICNKMLEELEPGTIKKSREFRAKYPDDIMNDNLAGQLWFGAECLAAGSSIMNKESESESMRPLAKAVTKSLEKVRALLREQCLSPQPEYTESIREHLKIFDRLFADFEFNYVRCMVHVKTAKEYELHQDLIVLFSETLLRAIREELVTQDAVDYCDPSLMFAIPRLAIVYGLLVCTKEGPLNVDRSSSEFPTLFLPFKNLLRKIRELLYTLEPNEVRVLEMLLCNLEEPANISVKLKEVQHTMQEREKEKEGKAQAMKLQAKLAGGEGEEGEGRDSLSAAQSTPAATRTTADSKLKRVSSIPCVCDSEAAAVGGAAAAAVDDDNQAAVAIAQDILDLVIREAVEKSVRRSSSCSSIGSSSSRRKEKSSSSKKKEKVEIDCTGPEIEVRVSPNKRNDGAAAPNPAPPMAPNPAPPMAPETPVEAAPPRNNLSTTTPSLSDSYSGMGMPSSRSRNPPIVSRMVPPSSHRSPAAAPNMAPNMAPATASAAAPQVHRSHGHHHQGSSLKRHNARRDTKRIPIRYQKDRRAKFKSTEDLLRRLYVCISGAADQLQSNYAGDFRSILRTVFVMNTGPDDDDDDEEDDESRNDQTDGAGAASGASGASATGTDDADESIKDDESPAAEAAAAAGGAAAASVGEGGAMAIPPGSLSGASGLAEVSPPSVLPPHALQIDVGTDAMQHDQIEKMYDEQLRPAPPDGVTDGAMAGISNADRRRQLYHQQAAPMRSQNVRRRGSLDDEEGGMGTSPPGGGGGGGHHGAVYAQNLDLVNQRLSHDSDVEITQPLQQEQFYQSEPTLLDIAQGAGQGGGVATTPTHHPTSPHNHHHHHEEELILNDTSPREISVPESAFYHRRQIESEASGGGSGGSAGSVRASPPPWIPDEAVTACMGCGDTFNLLRRRHHCRACGKVFCGRCSNHSMPLPQYRLDRPVRVCNRCHLMLNPATSAVSATDSAATTADNQLASSNTNSSSSAEQAHNNFYQRNFGMVS